jgi:hypothetical protein
MLCSGCAAHWPELNQNFHAPTASYQIPPKQIVTMVREIVSSPPLTIGVQEEKDGSIVTGFQRFPGEWHIGRRWQERTKYRVTVIPDWNEPTQLGRITVQEYTETRPADGMKWKPDAEVQRPDRSRKMLQTLDEAIKSRNPTTHS